MTVVSEVLGKSVLVVDDDPAYLSVLKLCMSTCGFGSIHTSSDGYSALEYLSERRVDLVVSDWNMAPMDGLELLALIRATPATASTPFVLMTASLSEFAWREAIELGVDDFLLKPFSLTSLHVACHLACRSVEFDASNVVPLRRRTKQRLLEGRSAHPAIVVPEAGTPARVEAKPPPSAAAADKSAERAGWRGCYERIRRLLAPPAP